MLNLKLDPIEDEIRIGLTAMRKEMGLTPKPIRGLFLFGFIMVAIGVLI